VASTVGVKRVIIAVSAAIVLLAAGAAAWLAWTPRHVPAGQPSLVTLRADSLSRFRAAFNRAQDRVRILVLLSPT
jgi:hypothetical protein